MLTNLAIPQVGCQIPLLTPAYYWPALQNDPADKLGEQGFDSETGEIHELKTGERWRTATGEAERSLRLAPAYRDSVHSKLGLSGEQLKETFAAQQQIRASRVGSPAELPMQWVLRRLTNVPSRRQASWSLTAEWARCAARPKMTQNLT